MIRQLHLFMRHNTKTRSVAYRSEYSNNRKKQVTLLMITDGQKQHYLTVTNLSALLRSHQITTKIFIV